MFGDELRYGRWDPWRELNRLQDEVNRLFSGAIETRAGGYPPMRVWTNDEGAVLRAELPGIQSKDLEISVLGDSVTLSGKRARDERREVTYHRREREFGDFTRTLQLPFRIEADKVSADYHNGVLELNLPRAAADRPQRIAVKVD